MKKIIVLIMSLGLIFGSAYAPQRSWINDKNEVYYDQVTSKEGGVYKIAGGSGKRFHINNETPYRVYVYISYTTGADCDFDSFHIDPELSSSVQVQKADLCCVKRISGYLYTPRGTEIELEPWTPRDWKDQSGCAAGGGVWAVKENGRGGASVIFVSKG